MTSTSAFQSYTSISNIGLDLANYVLDSIKKSQTEFFENIFKSQRESIRQLVEAVSFPSLVEMTLSWSKFESPLSGKYLTIPTRGTTTTRSSNTVSTLSVQKVVVSDLNENEYAISLILQKRQLDNFAFNSSRSAQCLLKALPDSVIVVDKQIVSITGELQGMDFDKPNYTMRIGSHYVKLNPSIEQFDLFEILLSTHEARMKCWEAIDLAEIIGLEPWEEEKWQQKLYWKIRNLNITIQRQTGFEQFMLYKGGVVRVNDPFKGYI